MTKYILMSLNAEYCVHHYSVSQKSDSLEIILLVFLTRTICALKESLEGNLLKVVWSAARYISHIISTLVFVFQFILKQNQIDNNL